MKIYNTLKEARQVALRLSRANPRLYYTFYSCFGIGISEAKHLHIFAPSDSPMGIDYYFKNGQQKQFTEAQRIADQNATPMMA